MGKSTVLVKKQRRLFLTTLRYFTIDNVVIPILAISVQVSMGTRMWLN